MVFEQSKIFLPDCHQLIFCGIHSVTIKASPASRSAAPFSLHSNYGQLLNLGFMEHFKRIVRGERVSAEGVWFPYR